MKMYRDEYALKDLTLVQSICFLIAVVLSAAVEFIKGQIERILYEARKKSGDGDYARVIEEECEAIEAVLAGIQRIDPLVIVVHNEDDYVSEQEVREQS